MMKSGRTVENSIPPPPESSTPSILLSLPIIHSFIPLPLPLPLQLSNSPLRGSDPHRPTAAHNRVRNVRDTLPANHLSETEIDMHKFRCVIRNHKLELEASSSGSGAMWSLTRWNILSLSCFISCFSSMLCYNQDPRM